MQEMNGQMEKGETLLISSGEYSDYEIHTLVLVLENCDIVELKRKFDETYRSGSENKFIHFLANELKVVEETPYRELYLGSYGLSKELKIYNSGSESSKKKK